MESLGSQQFRDDLNRAWDRNVAQMKGLDKERVERYVSPETGEIIKFTQEAGRDANIRPGNLFNTTWILIERDGERIEAGWKEYRKQRARLKNGKD